ncbi:acetyl-CoA carboxylase carboxyltransferase subunit alpha [Candidatus Rhabdochlamydia porcellionis]|jgi:acetyl-CoA carboxylase carboxyl transferase subunit alpha|uniref:Acetyl-coenzyme A carboxylase carboxyl transferase subunit alpha n=1 Tax=Candidatus Rhabdochlamydia porcellionis TaxID=225148 RepID=A0ABX8Z0S2_9BACT|nr:acetyl-CoA carboxylase carboxyltransferase subunit alpha [Candidatus Rhabdochlamydia porcellionis]QZA58940.1 Acetyl-coenzyme A carboxylase carboxyl transferase subunit alpha [Candidatus Rhabdochlamydia porcellionis]
MLAHEKQIVEYEKTISQLKEQNEKDSTLWTKDEIENLETKLEKLKKNICSQLTPWERVTISRHPKRPKANDYIRNLTEKFIELHGDRVFGDDPAIICGLAKIDDVNFMVIAQEKGHDTESRLHRNFGMPHPEGYRKALRYMRLAAKFHLPILCLIDTPGAYPGLAAEERGQGWAIAQNLFEMSRLSTPIIAILIGEGCSGGALGIGIADVIGMLEHSYYSVISPEAGSSILWKGTNQNETAAKALKMHVEDLLKFKIVDTKIEEPLGGAHHDPSFIYAQVKGYILEQYKRLIHIDPDVLIEQRYQKYRQIGKFLVEDMGLPQE